MKTQEIIIDGKVQGVWFRKKRERASPEIRSLWMGEKLERWYYSNFGARRFRGPRLVFKVV